MDGINDEGLSLAGLGLARNWHNRNNPLSRIGTGTGYAVDAIYPFPSTYARATAKQRARRDAELEQAKIDNWYDDTLIPGAVVHGNVGSPDVGKNNLWTVHGKSADRSAFSNEDQLGMDDSDPGEDGVDTYESLFYYIEKNWPLWLQNTGAVDNLTRLMSILTENVLDGEPTILRLNMVDPVVTLVPAIRTGNIDHWDFYPPLPDRYPKQPFDEEFRDDDVIAWAQLANSSPYSRLEPYTEHQENFKVTNEMFRQTEAFRNDDLDQAMAEGRVFKVDYKDFHELNTRPPANGSGGGRLYTPIAMFAVPKGGGDLKTIAIQSTQHTPANDAERQAWKENNTQDADRPLSDILTPASDYWSWQMTKNVFMSMYAMSSVVDHLSTHIFLGPIPISFYRNIPNQHPLTALLEPHLLSLVRNNHGGIFAETGSQDPNTYGPADKGILTGSMNKVTGWTGQTFIDAAAQRSAVYDFVTHSTTLDRSQPNAFSRVEDFPLHDDEGIFPIVERWARNYLSLYYRSDQDVRDDHEVQAFCRELANEGQVNGFPESLAGMDDLVDMVTRVIFWMTNNHALEATLGCIKLAPLGYWSDRVPRNDEVKTEEDWFNILPALNVGLAIFCASRIFVDLPRDWFRSLGRYPEGQFMHDRRVYQHLTTFQDELFALDNQIIQKNETRRWPYSMKRPATMTCSPWN